MKLFLSFFLFSFSSLRQDSQKSVQSIPCNPAEKRAKYLTSFNGLGEGAEMRQTSGGGEEEERQDAACFKTCV